MRKIIIIVIALFILNNCGYTPIYSSKEKNFYIEKISQKNTSKLNSKIVNNLKIFFFIPIIWHQKKIFLMKYLYKCFINLCV